MELLIELLIDKKKVKKGKWIRFGHDNHLQIVKEVTDDYILTVDNYTIYRKSAQWDTVKLWKPKKNELVIFWKDDDKESWTLRKYNRKQHKIYLDIIGGVWDNVAPLKYIKYL